MLLQSKAGVLVDLIHELLKGHTDAGEAVLVARTWPVKASTVPVLLVDPIYDERKDSLGKGAPYFDTTVTVKVRGRVSSPSGNDDAGGIVVGRALETLKRQIERRIINAYPVMLKIEHFPQIQTSFEINTDNELAVGELLMHVAMQFPEGPEDFAQPETTPLKEVRIYPDMQSPADPTGTYSPAQHPFPGAVTPAPRTTGPDGRLEGGEIRIDTDPDD